MRAIRAGFCDKCVTLGAPGSGPGKSVLPFPLNTRGTIVKTHPFYSSLAVDLTPSDFQVLQQINDGANISAILRTRLEARDMIEKGLNSWRLTEQGSYRLAAGQGWKPPRYPRPDQLSI
jgi:hypothetical protein